jgi:hypothetical protein
VIFNEEKSARTQSVWFGTVDVKSRIVHLDASWALDSEEAELLSFGNHEVSILAGYDKTSKFDGVLELFVPFAWNYWNYSANIETLYFHFVFIGLDNLAGKFRCVEE